jgi:hypothetical protein
LKRRESPSADLASRLILRAPSISDNLFTSVSPPAPNPGVGQPAAVERAALDAAFPLLAPRHAHDFSAEPFDPIRFVFNCALHFHHKPLRRAGCPPAFSLRAANDIPSHTRIFRRIRLQISTYFAKHSPYLVLNQPLQFSTPNDLDTDICRLSTRRNRPI